ncbi:MAG TPA: S8 family peptidase [Vicinamibacterales bacterium]|nr:S8 family peptidase [Vicinamibacterales bacterium]
MAKKSVRARAASPRPRGQGRQGRQAARVSALASTEPGRACTVVYIHGIGNKPVESILKCQWDQALFGYDLGSRSRLAYWVNREYYPSPSGGTCASGDLTEVEHEPTGRALSVEQHLEQTGLDDEVAALTDDPREQAILLKIASRIDEHVVPARVAGARAAGIHGFILPLPEPLRRWITRKLTRAFARDVNDYLFVKERRDAMRQSLIDRLDAGGGPFIVVAHSQGTMVAYDVLSEMTDLDVPLFVTIGSPLGIQEVQDQLKRFTKQKALAVPKCVGHWLNVYDGHDPVAADEELANDFAPRGGAIEDVEVVNPDSPAHPHSGTGYLRTDPVRHAVRDAVRVDLFQPVAPFVIARNLVRRLENAPREAQHPVLIELVDRDKAGVGVEKVAQELAAGIRQLTGRSDEQLRLQIMRRYLAADLTRWETETLASQFAMRGLLVKRIWRNEAKRALLESSINTIHAGAAHVGYRAHGRGIAWGVLDSGINAEHPHFATHQNIASQVDCTGRGVTEGKAPDRHGHGTHVAGIIAGARTFPGAGAAAARVISGVAPEAKLHIYRVLDGEGNGEDAWIIKALDHIADMNERAGKLVIHGVNLSLGGPFDQSTYGCGHTPLCDELRRLWRQGVLVVLAAGNEGFAVLRSLEGDIDTNMDLSIGDPANLDDAIAVGSVHKENPHTYGVSYFSSRGPTGDGRQKPDVVAPGERILSCRHRMPKHVRGVLVVDDEYVEMSGTSMAAPHVSGALAAFLSVRREFIGEADRVKQHLMRNCTDLSRDRFQQGAGLPNLVKMLVNI